MGQSSVVLLQWQQPVRSTSLWPLATEKGREGPPIRDHFCFPCRVYKKTARCGKGAALACSLQVCGFQDTYSGQWGNTQGLLAGQAQSRPSSGPTAPPFVSGEVTFTWCSREPQLKFSFPITDPPQLHSLSGKECTAPEPQRRRSATPGLERLWSSGTWGPGPLAL